MEGPENGTDQSHNFREVWFWEPPYFYIRFLIIRAMIIFSSYHLFNISLDKKARMKAIKRLETG
jgi:hypothetical protein